MRFCFFLVRAVFLSFLVLGRGPLGLADEAPWALSTKSYPIQIHQKALKLTIRNAPLYLHSWIQNAYLESFQRFESCQSFRKTAPAEFQRVMNGYGRPEVVLDFVGAAVTDHFPPEPIAHTNSDFVVLRRESFLVSGERVLSKVCFLQSEPRAPSSGCASLTATGIRVHADALDQRRMCGNLQTLEYNRLAFTLMEGMLRRRASSAELESARHVIDRCRANSIIQDDAAYRLPMGFWTRRCENE
jgi:hypothetical protein